MSVATRTFGKLVTFEDFVRGMRSQLTLVPERKLKPLLECLYQAAKAKSDFEDYRGWALDMTGRCRKMGNALDAAGKALRQASRILERANEGNNHLEQIELIEGDFKFNFGEIILQVKRSEKAASDGQTFLAAMIHPQLRTKPEDERARRLRNPDLNSEFLEALVFPAREKSPDIAHWFIGAAAECLDKFRTSSGGIIPRYDKIISKAFEVAFDDTARDDENIRTELTRQKAAGRPAYQIPGQAIPGQPITRLYGGDLGQRSRANTLPNKKMSGQKPKN